MTFKRVGGLALALTSLISSSAVAQPRYDGDRLIIKGVQFLQDYKDPKLYYYLPDAPRLAVNADGTLAFLALKYVSKGNTAGGLFHCLIEFTYPPEALDQLEQELRKKIPNAKIAGPVPLLPAKSEGEGQPGSFEIVSAVLSDRAAGGMTRTLITSGTAPLTPGSQAAVAAMLNQDGATLLWDSLTGPTSDISVAINAYYVAVITGFSARVSADVSTVYTHYSSVFNQQKEYSRRQIRDVTDNLQREGILNVTALDGGAAHGLKADEMSRLLDLITQKLTELIFDHKTGFSADPEREAAIEPGQLLGRQERSWLSRTFGGTDDTKYYTDDQWVLKDRKDIRHNKFEVNLAKNTTIKVPFSTAGNIHGLFKELGADRRYFRVVDVAGDPDFQKRDIQFQVDGDYVDSFNDTINFVAVNLRKRYADTSRHDALGSFRLDGTALKKGQNVQTLTYPWLGAAGPDVENYEYRIQWSVRDRPTVSQPPTTDAWIKSVDPVVSLIPPFQKIEIDVDADRLLFKDKTVRTGVVELKYPLVGRVITSRKATLRDTDTDGASKITFYRDREGPKTQFRVNWYYKDGKTVKGDWADLDGTYFNLVPPAGQP